MDQGLAPTIRLPLSPVTPHHISYCEITSKYLQFPKFCQTPVLSPKSSSWEIHVAFNSKSNITVIWEAFGNRIAFLPSSPGRVRCSLPSFPLYCFFYASTINIHFSHSSLHRKFLAGKFCNHTGKGTKAACRMTAMK